MRSRVVRGEGLRWPEAPVRAYKEGGERFRDVVRRPLVGPNVGDDLAFELRYFEVAPGGFTSFERHRHPHAVIVVAGRGEVRLGDERHPLEPFDAVYVAPGEPHRFFAADDARLGFLCVVDAERDRPEPLDDAGG